MTVRLGFIGAGHHATHNLYPALRYTDCRLVAVADLQAERRAQVARAYGPEATYDDYRKLLERDDLDAVCVSGPAALHHEAGLAAIERGLGVYLEKPPAPTLAETYELREAARRKGVVCMVGFMKRFALRYRAAADIARQPAFGRKTHLLLRYSHAAGGTSPHAMLTTMTIHALDLSRFFMGEVAHLQWDRDGVEGTDNLAVHFRFASGAMGTLISNNQAPGVLERLELTGEKAMVVVDELTCLTHYPRSEGAAWSVPRAEVWSPNTALQTRENDSHALQGYLGEIEAFIAAVRSGEPPTDATMDDGVAAMRLCQIIASQPRGEAEVTHD